LLLSSLNEQFKKENTPAFYIGFFLLSSQFLYIARGSFLDSSFFNKQGIGDNKIISQENFGHSKVPLAFL
jgi:hypothetical protein